MPDLCLPLPITYLLQAPSVSVCPSAGLRLTPPGQAGKTGAGWECEGQRVAREPTAGEGMLGKGPGVGLGSTVQTETDLKQQPNLSLCHGNSAGPLRL